MSPHLTHHAHLVCGHIAGVSEAEYRDGIAMLECWQCGGVRAVEKLCGRSR